MRVAQAGIRGVPANFGGSETAVEEIGSRLAADGVEVVVYCRRHKSLTDAVEYRGMRRVVLPSIPSFHLDTISHSVVATLHLRFRDTADVVHYHGMGNALCLPLLVGSRKKAVITIDGPDWERPKWGPLSRRVLRFSARLAVRHADYLVIDNHPSIEYFRREFGIPDSKFTYIGYGADTERPSATDALTEFGLVPRGYMLFVGAMVPDKGPDILIDAYSGVGGEMPLVLVGDSPFAPEFRRRLREAASADPRVRMLGYVYGEAYRQLVANAYVYVHPLRSDGTSPALLQAMGYGNCVVSSDLDEVLDATDSTTITFASGDASDLARQLERVLADPELVERYRTLALERVLAEYDWDDVAARHRAVYGRVLGAPS